METKAQMSLFLSDDVTRRFCRRSESLRSVSLRRIVPRHLGLDSLSLSQFPVASISTHAHGVVLHIL